MQLFVISVFASLNGSKRLQLNDLCIKVICSPTGHVMMFMVGVGINRVQGPNAKLQDYQIVSVYHWKLQAHVIMG